MFIFYVYIVDMAQNNNSTPDVHHPSLSLRSLLEKEKLEDNDTNYMDWIRSVRIVLRQEEKLYVLTEPVSPEPAANATRVVKDQYLKHKRDATDVCCLMLSTMCKNLQKDLEHLEIIELNTRLMEMFQI